MARQFAGIIGIILIATGVLGLVLGDQHLFGILNIDVVEDVIHLITGGLLAYVGFGQRDDSLARNALTGLGAVYVLVGIIGFVAPQLFGLLPHGYTTFDNLFHIGLGVVLIVVGRMGRGRDETVHAR
jgi:hypothetical protein